MSRPKELWIFWTAEQAHAAGFRLGKHRMDGAMRCWAVTDGVRIIEGVSVARVVSVLRMAEPPRDRADALNKVAAEGYAMLQARMPEVWVEL